jgi:hypothetical protein
MQLIVSTGNYPFAVYPDVIIQSAKSNTALVISETYALVGRGFVYIDSTIWVATIKNFPCFKHFDVINFCNNIIFYRAVSMPRSPRATIIPSDAAII